MARQLTVNATDRLSVIQQGSIRLGAAAHLGQTGDGGWDLDDDAAALLFPGLKVARLTDDASGATKHIWRGRIWVKDLSRGDHVLADARQYGVNVVDSNWDLTKLRVHGWVRPAETDYARVQALRAYILNGSSSTVTNARKRASTVIGATTYVPNTNTVNMPARTYDAMDPWGVLDDCSRAAGKTYFVIVNDDGTLDLFYDLPTSTAYASTLSITDSSPDLSTSFPPIHEDSAGTQDPSELLSGVGLVIADGSVVTGFDSAVEAANDVAEATVYDQGATSTALGTARVAVIKAQRGVEEARYRCSILLTPAQAHLMKAGMTLPYRDAAAGVTSPITVRASRVDHEIASPGMYLVHLELNFPEKIAARLADVGRPIIPRPVTGAAITDFQLTIQLRAGSDLVATYLAAGFHLGGGVQLTIGRAIITGYPVGIVTWQLRDDLGNNYLGGPFPIGTTTTIIMGTAGANQYARVGSVVAVAPISAWGALVTRIYIANNPSPNTDANRIFVENIASGAQTIDNFNRVDAAAWGTASGVAAAWVVDSVTPVATVDGSAGTLRGSTASQMRITLSDAMLGSLPPSAYYGEVYGAIDVAIADGAASSWTLPYPTVYVPGSLVVYVDGVRQTCTETSPSAGTFSLPWVPALGDYISAQWRVPAVV